jgi:WD40 repeat protein
VGQLQKPLVVMTSARLHTLLATILLCLVGSLSASAQPTVSISDIDASGFPTLKAKLFAFDDAGAQQRPTAAELGLTENGIPRTVVSVSCPPPAGPRALSSVLVVDASGSMAFGPGTQPNIVLARAAAHAWIDALPLGQSDCALTSFDHQNYLHQDFTVDRARLGSAIDALTPNGGTDYDMALLKPLAGGLQISRRGTHKRIIVFLTDGISENPTSVTEIVAEANRQNCAIYVVTLGMSCPNELRAVASGTGGTWHENVTTVEEAEATYRRILYEAQTSSPCDITWLSSPCPEGARDVEVTWRAARGRSSYTVPAGKAVSIAFSPSSLLIRSKPVGVRFDTTVTITAVNGALNVTGITSTNPAFTIAPTSFALAAGASRAVTLSFTPVDSNYAWTELTVESDLCARSFYASASYPRRRANTSSIHLDHPNGGEVFFVGSDTVITWSGIAPSDSVVLEYSIDDGANWRTVTPRTVGGRYTWKVPNTPSDRCLARVTRVQETVADGSGLVHLLAEQNDWVYEVAWSPDGGRIVGVGDQRPTIWNAETGARIRSLTSHTAPLYSVDWSPDGSRVVTGSADNYAKLWDPNSGALIASLAGHFDLVVHVRFSPTGSRIATASLDGTVKIWNTSNGSLVTTLTGHDGGATVVEWSPDGTRVVTASGDGRGRIFNASTGALLYELVGHAGPVYDVTWSPLGNRVATASADGTARLWDPSNGGFLASLAGHAAEVYRVAFSPDGSRVVTGSLDGTARIWNATSGARVFTLAGHTNGVGAVAFSPDGALVATGGGDARAMLWDAGTGQRVQTFDGHREPISVVRFSPDGSRLATGSYDTDVRIWEIPASNAVSDRSDARFTIVAPTPRAIDVDMGQVLVGGRRDSVVTTFISNASLAPFRVDSIKVTGINASRFAVVSGFPPYTVAGNGSSAVELRFLPNAVGPVSAQLVIFTQTGALVRAIRGIGVEPQLEIVGGIIDFGQVSVGKFRDTLRAVTVRNVGTSPLPLTGMRHAGPNAVDFTTLAGGAMTLQPGDTALVDLRYTPSTVGRTSGRLLFDYDGTGSPAEVMLFGEGVTVEAVGGIIDFGKVVVGLSRDSLQAATIRNIGSVAITITGAEPGGTDASDFTTLSAPALTLAPGDTARVDLRFTPGAIGPRTGHIIVSYEGGPPATVTLVGEGVDAVPMVEVVAAEIDFGKVVIGTSRDSLQAATVRNVGTIPVTIASNQTAGTDVADFTVLGNATITIAPGETARVDMKFAPGALGARSGELLVDYGGNAPAIVRLIGEGVEEAKPAFATLGPGNAEAYVGDTVDIPIVLRSSTNLELSGATGFVTRLRFNGTLLEPIGATPRGAMEGADRVIPLELSLPAGADGVLALLRFKVGLGTDTLTSLVLEETQSLDGPVTASVEVGSFHLFGVCMQGGPRLVNPSGAVTLTVSANPAHGDDALAHVGTIELGRTVLALTDVDGRIVRTLIDGELAPGAHEIPLDLHAVASGIYFLTLRTETESRTILMEVSK